MFLARGCVRRNGIGFRQLFDWVCGNWGDSTYQIALDTLGAPLRSVVIWDKEWIVGPLNALRQRYELVFHSAKGSGMPTGAEPDIWPVKWASKRPSGHESEKPVDLMKRCIEVGGGEIMIRSPEVERRALPPALREEIHWCWKSTSMRLPPNRKPTQAGCSRTRKSALARRRCRATCFACQRKERAGLPASVQRRRATRPWC